MFIYMNKIKNEDSINGTEYSLVSENGVSIIVPNDWIKADSQSNESIVAVANSSSKDLNGFNDINVNIEKKNLTTSLLSEFNTNYDNLATNSGFTILYSGNISKIGGYDAMEADYTSNVGGIEKRHKAIWIGKDNEVYVILCTSPQSSFEEQEPIFNSIISSFKFT